MEADFFQHKDLQREEIEKLIGKENMYTGLDPVKSDCMIKNLVERAKSSLELDKKVFKLIDTYTLTATLFEAVRPPVAVVLCGEGRRHAASFAMFTRLYQRYVVPRDSDKDGEESLG